MESELTIHPILMPDSHAAVIFLHGVNGDWRKTWENQSTGFYWPSELANRAGWQTFSIQYDAHTNWSRTSMPLQERAASIAELLRDSPALAGKDIALVAHSFGGIVVKQLIRHCSDRERFLDLRERLAATVFLATPHNGADIATFGQFLKWTLGSSVTLEDLRAHSPLLNDLADWYRNAEIPPAHVLYETRKLRFRFRRWLMIVDRNSANPGLRGVAAVPVDADHIEISRPASSESVQFNSVQRFLANVFAVPARLSRYPRQAAAVCYRRRSGNSEFLLVRTTGGRWTFPKGGVEASLGMSGSAAQEALEEAGVTGAIESQPFIYYLHAKRELKADEGRASRFCVAAFLLEVQTENARTPERGRTPTWFNPAEAKQRLAEDRSVIYREEFSRVVDTAVRQIASKIQSTSG
jgi:8-oxo-dGTP pyrophosphatase MutT (NUDIX family)/predicted alpha/beta hydrolase family esterase